MTVAVVNDVALTIVDSGPLLEHLQVLAVGIADQASIVVAVKKWRLGGSGIGTELLATVEGSNELSNWTPLPGGPHLLFQLPTVAADSRAQLAVGGYRYLRVRYELRWDGRVSRDSSSVLFTSTLALVPKEQ